MKLSFESVRRFGVEFEYLAFDGKNRPETGHKPEGIDYLGMLVARNSPDSCLEIKDWEHTQNNEGWVIKPDSSCGMEVCTPILKGWTGLKKCLNVIHAIQLDPKVKVDNRCSVHVHIEIVDLTKEQLASVIAHWFKVEPIFMDSVPPTRKRNRYCQFMGMMELIEHDTKIVPDELIKRVGNVKYYSLNTNQYVKNGRKAIEFRIAEGKGCKDPYFVKNWVRLLIHFVEMAANRPLPSPYDETKPDDPWQSFLWLDIEDTMKLLGFDGEYELSPGLVEMRNWFLARILENIPTDENSPRCYAYKELKSLLNKYEKNGIYITTDILYPRDMKSALYSEETKK